MAVTPFVRSCQKTNSVFLVCDYYSENEFFSNCSVVMGRKGHKDGHKFHTISSVGDLKTGTVALSNLGLTTRSEIYSESFASGQRS